MQNLTFLLCPCCKGALSSLSTQFICDNCGQNYQSKHGILNLTLNKPLPDFDERDGQPETPSWKNLISRHNIDNPQSHDFQTTVDALTGEYVNFFKFLLPDISNANILYLGNNENETPHNIARQAGRLTVLLSSDKELMFIVAKNRLRKVRSNIVYISLESQQILPFAEHCFDGIIIDQSISPLLVKTEKIRPGNDIFLDELKCILKPDGWLYIKSENPYSRLKTLSIYSALISILALSKRKNFLNKKKALSASKPPENNSQTSIPHYQSLLKRHGFSFQRIAAFDNNKFSIIDLQDTHHISKHIASEKGILRNIPAWLYKRTVPITGIFTQQTQLAPSILESIISKVLKSAGIDRQHCNIASIESNRKCKCIIILNVSQPQAHTIVIKIPIDELAERNLKHNHNGLIHLDTFSSSTFFPKPICCDYYIKTPYFVEYGIAGKSWSHYKYFDSVNFLVEDVVNAIKGIRWISKKHSNLKVCEEFNSKIEDISTWAKLRSSKEYIELRSLTQDLEAMKEGEDAPVYFYKSDFSVSNIFLKNKEVSGIIDLDFWGYSHNKLVDYADFIESFSRNFLGMSQAEVLVKIHKEELFDFQPALDINRHLRKLNGNIDDLKSASLIAWVNRVHHAFEFKRVTLDEAQTKKLFFEPLEMMFKASTKRITL